MSTPDLDHIALNPLAASEEDFATLMKGLADEEEPQDEKVDDDGYPVDDESATSGAEKEPGDKEKPIEAKPEPEKSDDGKDTAKAEPVEAKQPDPPRPEDEFDPRKVVVKTADGKHEIPYTAYDSARTRAAEASRAARLAEEQTAMERGQREVVEREVQSLKAQLAQLQQAPAQAAQQPAKVGLDPETMEILQAESPAIHALIQSMHDQIQSLHTQHAEARQIAERAENTIRSERKRTAEERVEEAVANDPVLVYLREKDPDRFAAVAQIDGYLITQPQYQNLPIPQRIATARKMYEAAHGTITVPGLPTPEAKVTAPAPAAAPAAAKPAGVPNTLSDIPAGSIPPASEAENVDGLNQHQLVHKLMNMQSADDIVRYVGSLPL